MSIISNTTVLSNFATIYQLDILRQLFETIYISTEVYEEIQQGVDEGYVFYNSFDSLITPPVTAGWIRLTGMFDEYELNDFRQMPARLHPGEASCLAIVRHRGWLMLTDDRAARDYAVKHNIRLSGTIGCLILVVERGISNLAQANRWLAQMIKSGYRAPLTDLTTWIRR